jgi:hypothetical protein
MTKWRKHSTPTIPGFPRFTYLAADCPQCGGSGVNPTTNGRCPTCVGSGLICQPDHESRRYDLAAPARSPVASSGLAPSDARIRVLNVDAKGPPEERPSKDGLSNTRTEISALYLVIDANLMPIKSKGRTMTPTPSLDSAKLLVDKNPGTIVVDFKQYWENVIESGAIFGLSGLEINFPDGTSEQRAVWAVVGP